MTPEKLGRYDILGELGKGAMGVVYLAQDPLIGRQLAIKTFRQSYSASDPDYEQFRERFLREARTAGALNHPNIVTIHDMDATGSEEYFIAMEYVEGTDLKQIMRRKRRLDPRFAADVVRQIAEGLSYAHSKGVIHRDVKPANIIITKDNKAKITDFGIARMGSSNLTMKGQLLGTPNYMSPEQIQGREVDHRSDLFSLGVLLYEMLTGRKPFAGDSLTVVSHRIIYDEYTPPEEVVKGLPPRLSEIVTRALAKKPEDRYQDGKDLAAELRSVLEEDEEGSGSGSSAAGVASDTPRPAAPSSGSSPISGRVIPPEAAAYLETPPSAKVNLPDPPALQPPPPLEPLAVSAPAARRSPPPPPSSAAAPASSALPPSEDVIPTTPIEIPARLPAPPPRASQSERPRAPLSGAVEVYTGKPASPAPARTPARTPTGRRPGATPAGGAPAASRRLALVGGAVVAVLLAAAVVIWVAIARRSQNPHPSPAESPQAPAVDAAYAELIRQGRQHLAYDRPTAAQAPLLEAYLGWRDPEARQLLAEIDRLAVAEEPDPAAAYIGGQVAAAERLFADEEFAEALAVSDHVLELVEQERARDINNRAAEALARQQAATSKRPRQAGSQISQRQPTTSAPELSLEPRRGGLHIHFVTEIADGEVQVTAGDQELFKQPFDFPKKGLFSRRIKEPGILEKTLDLPVGTYRLHVRTRVKLKKEWLVLEQGDLGGNVVEGETRQLEITVSPDAEMTVSLQ